MTIRQLTAGMMAALLCPTLASAASAGGGYRLPSAQEIAGGSLVPAEIGEGVPEGALPAVPIGAESTVHVAFDGSYSLISTYGESRSPVVLTSVPELGPDGGLEPRLKLAWFEIRPEEGLTALLFEYVYSSGGRGFADGRTYLGVCVLRGGQPTGACQSYEVAESDVAYFRQEAPGAKWLYLAIDSSEPARSSGVCSLTRDHDGDGFDDLVLWRRSWRSVTAREFDPDDEDSPEFVMVSEELLVLGFDPAGGRFRAPVPAGDLEMPPAELCGWERS